VTASGGPSRLHPDDIALIADAVVERLRMRQDPDCTLLDASGLAQRLGVSVDWVRANADKLGVIRLGNGPRARLRFDPRNIGELTTARFARDAGPVAPVARRRRAPRTSATLTAAGNPLLPDPQRGPL
jgi:hypothetical protein